MIPETNTPETNFKKLESFRKAGLQLKVNKCEFEMKITKYLSFMIEVNKNISMDPVKIEIIVNWEVPKTVKKIQRLLGFAKFYRKFIKRNF